ncbi:putative spermidine/putrescine transport system substrate-binding protein [Rhizobiales bacterium GAS188]|nr:putative spermidine/putrescine transport system substrate-binding protein [Rhizobiales bacterium GAS188]
MKRSAGFLALLVATAANADPVRLMSYSDAAFQDNYTNEVITPFNQKGAAQVQFVGGTTSAGMLGQLRTQKNDPQLDLVIMDTTTAAIACAEGLVEPATEALVPALKELDPQARKAGGDCGPGVTFDHLVISYDSKLVSPAPTSLSALWDKKWSGKLGVSAPPNIQGLALTAVLAHAETGDWKQADGAFKKLRDLAPAVQTFDPQPDSYTLILNGTLAFGTGWNARAQLNHDRSGGQLGVMLPSEGTVFQINTINVVKGAHNRDAAFAFMNYALGEQAQKAFTEKSFYAPTNPRAAISPAVAARTAVAPDNLARVIPLDWSEMIKLRETWNQRWRREVISAGTR